MEKVATRTTPVAGRFRLLDRIGNGQMSTVYKAEDMRRSDALVAIKLLDTAHPDDLRKEFFRREVQALERLDHKNVVRILNRGESTDHGCFFLSLEWLPYTLQEVRTRRIGERGWLGKTMLDLANALAHAHSMSVIHRDIKPSNILFDEADTVKLGDFGISRIKNELSTGLTLAHFWSLPYAAPEQRRGEKEDERSDIYALGVVYYELICGHPPTTDGPTVEDISRLRVPESIQALIRRMTASQPDDRPKDAAEVRSMLRATATAPTVRLIVNDAVCAQLYRELDVIPKPALPEAREWLGAELNDGSGSRVKLTLDERSGDILLHGSRIRLRCIRHLNYPALVIKYADLPYPPNHETARETGRVVNAEWELVSPREIESTPEATVRKLRETINRILDLGHKHSLKKSADRARRNDRKGFVETWDKILRYQQRLLDDATQPLEYKAVREQQGIVTFALKQAPPDSLGWPEGAVIAVIGMGDNRATPIGELLEVTADRVSVLRSAQYVAQADVTDEVPAQGTISLFSPERLATIQRQANALSLLRSGETANPRMSEVLSDITRADFDETDPTITFFQPELAEDKRQAVREALATRDIYLLQGPPGTGKTATIAEILLQILRENPESRILVSSQSNVAVNHVLSRITAVQSGLPLEIVRLGRSDKIGRGGEQWQLEHRQEVWRQEVLARCEGVRESLADQIRQKQAGQKNAKAILSEKDLRECRDWLEEATHALEALRQNELQAELLNDQAMAAASLEDSGPSDATITRSERVGLLEVIERQRARLRDDLSVIRGFLPDRYQHESTADLEEELTHLRDLITDLSEPGAADDHLTRRRRLVNSWMQVVGLGAEFAAPLMGRANILAATCLFSGGNALRRERYDWVIIDEAGRATAPELLVPLVRAERAILVGDERQLPPLLDEDLSEKRLAEAGITAENLEQSLFESLIEDARARNKRALRMLRTQHRMHPAIGQLVSDVFYGGDLLHGISQDERQHGLTWIPRPVSWISTSGLKQRADERKGTSYANPAEAKIVEDLLELMERDYAARGETREVGVIAGYMGQVSDLIDRIAPEDHSRWQALDIEIATVDAFQGRDRDVIVYSTVRSNPARTIGFLRDRRRLNVSLSRAKELLVVVGDADMLESAGASGNENPFRSVLNHMRSHREECAIVTWDAFAPLQVTVEKAQ